MCNHLVGAFGIGCRLWDLSIARRWRMDELFLATTGRKLNRFFLSISRSNPPTVGPYSTIILVLGMLPLRIACRGWRTAYVICPYIGLYECLRLIVQAFLKVASPCAGADTDEPP